ncbi:hypothetical protein ACHAWF_007957 [Thalassiosira exigua]
MGGDTAQTQLTSPLTCLPIIHGIFFLDATVTVALALMVSASAVLFIWRRQRRFGLNPSSWNRGRPKSFQSQTCTLEEKKTFLKRVGSSYGYANSKRGFIDDWRVSEFPTLIRPMTLPPRSCQQQRLHPQRPAGYVDGGLSDLEVYLDYAGSAIPTRTLLSRISHCEQILANPHSQGGGLASDRTMKLMQLAKDRVLQHFGIQHETFGLEELDQETSPGAGTKRAIPCPGYHLVFTSGATESLRLVAERFPWSWAKITGDPISRTSLRCSHELSSVKSPATKQLLSLEARSLFLYPNNVHTSVIGMRNIAIQQRARFQCVSPDKLLNASSEWFKDLVKGCMSFEYQEGDNGHDEILSVEVNAEEELARQETFWMHHLLVLPLECNFSGDRFDWSKATEMAQKSCFTSNVNCFNEKRQQLTSIRICHKWHVLLDSAKAAATSTVNLPTLASSGGPDFAVVSFYKMFGAPTGLGALFVKKQRGRRLRETEVSRENGDSNGLRTIGGPYMTADGTSKQDLCGISLERTLLPRHFFGGGSVDVLLANEDFMAPRNSGRPAFASLKGNVGMGNAEGERIDLGVMVHGTEHFRGIANLVHGFQEIDNLGGMDAISFHSTCLAAELVRKLFRLAHGNGKPAVQLYGQWQLYASGQLRGDRNSSSIPHPGPTVAFNICDQDGSLIGYDEVSRLASLNDPPIQIRTGCFCNPGACQEALHLTNFEVLENFRSGHVCGDRRGVINGKPTGAARASFGKDSIYEDLDALVSFIRKVFVSRGEPTYCASRIDLEDESAAPTMFTKIESLFVFPIKSCAAMRVKRWPIDPCTGRFAYDREFALVDTSETEINLDTKVMTVTAPNHEDLILSVEAKRSAGNHVSPEDIQVCGTLCQGEIWGGGKASKWFSTVLGGWGMLVDSRHFRPNIVTASYQGDTFTPKNETRMNANPEDTWQQIIIEGIADQGSSRREVELRAVGKCARCQMVDIDPSSGMKGKTLRALAQYRREKGKINFGTFFTGCCTAPEGSLVLEEGAQPWFPRKRDLLQRVIHHVHSRSGNASDDHSSETHRCFGGPEGQGKRRIDQAREEGERSIRERARCRRTVAVLAIKPQGARGAIRDPRGADADDVVMRGDPRARDGGRDGRGLEGRVLNLAGKLFLAYLDWHRRGLTQGQN